MIGTVLLVAIPMVMVSVLYTFRPPLPNNPISLSYYVNGSGTEPAWGDGSDCKNVGGGGGSSTQTCLSLGVIQMIFTSPPSLPISSLLLVFYCNGTVYLSATFAEMAWVPGSTGTVGNTGPQLQHCGSYVPPKAAWNRFAFFDQVTPGAAALRPGDSLFVYSHTFTTFTDDDFHGAPLWCYYVPGACTVDIYYTGTPVSLAASLPLYGLAQ